MQINLPFKPQAVLFDLDGTLLDDQKQIKPGIIEVLRNFRKKGVKVGVCTGRQYAVIYDQVLPYFEDEDLHVISGGAEVIWNDGRVIWGRYMDSDLVKYLFTELDKVGAELFFGQNKNVFMNALKFPRVSAQTRALAKNPLEINLEDWKTPLMVVDFLNEQVEGRMQEFERQGLIDEVLVKKMTHTSGDPSSFSNYYYDVTPEGINKSVGLKVWTREQGVEMEKVLVFGDNANDVEMLEVAGWGVAMKSGTEAARKVAKEVIPDVNEGGLEEYLREIGRTKL